MGFNAVCLLVLTFFLRPPSSLLFAILLVLGYFQITLFSDVPNFPPDWQSLFGGLIPVLITGYWIWKQAFSITLPHFRDAPFTLALWQGAGYWVGVESSTVFARFPISRLGYDTLTPSGFLALMIIVGLILLVIGYQALAMRKQGLLRYYLVRYLPFLPMLLILSNVPSYTLRLHHYLLALLAIPVLSLPNRLSLMLQAFMLGLWLDGVGRWGWASLLEKTSSVRPTSPLFFLSHFVRSWTLRTDLLTLLPLLHSFSVMLPLAHGHPLSSPTSAPLILSPGHPLPPSRLWKI